MKTIGLIGGMGRESTVTYDQVINETVREAIRQKNPTKYMEDEYELQDH